MSAGNAFDEPDRESPSSDTTALTPSADQPLKDTANPTSSTLDTDAAEAASGQPENEVDVAVNRFGVPTMGGVQFWGDVAFLQGWKIQRNVFTGHHRLLDHRNKAYFSGTLEQCEAALQKIRQEKKLTADTGRAVVLIHGIGRSSRSFPKLIDRLRTDGYVVVPFEYPSTRLPLEQSAECLECVLQSLTDVASIDFVVHSMGGLVVRTLLKRQRDNDTPADPRLHRMVMLGTPNHGAELADMLRTTAAFGLIYGPAGQQLVTASNGTIGQLPVPDFEFAVIAGGKGTPRGYNPLLPGDNDGTVTVASTRLNGAADFLLVPRLHSFLMNDATVINATSHFLQHGRLDPLKPLAPVVSEANAFKPHAAEQAGP